MKRFSTFLILAAMIGAGPALAQTSGDSSNKSAGPGKTMRSDPSGGSSPPSSGTSSNAGGSASSGAGSGISGQGLTTGGSNSGQQQPAADAENRRQPGAKSQ